MWFSSPRTGRTMLTPAGSAGGGRRRGHPRAERDDEDVVQCRTAANTQNAARIGRLDHPALLLGFADNCDSGRRQLAAK